MKTQLMLLALLSVPCLKADIVNCNVSINSKPDHIYHTTTIYKEVEHNLGIMDLLKSNGSYAFDLMKSHPKIMMATVGAIIAAKIAHHKMTTNERR